MPVENVARGINRAKQNVINGNGKVDEIMTFECVLAVFHALNKKKKH